TSPRRAVVWASFGDGQSPALHGGLAAQRLTGRWAYRGHARGCSLMGVRELRASLAQAPAGTTIPAATLAELLGDGAAEDAPDPDRASHPVVARAALAGPGRDAHRHPRVGRGARPLEVVALQAPRRRAPDPARQARWGVGLPVR